MTEGSRRTIVAAFLANLGIAAAKFVAAAATGSAAMLAETIHSFADAGNQGLLMVGSRRARRDPTPEHPFGYGGERYFWAFVVALVLFTMGGLFSIVEGVDKLRYPHELNSVGWAGGVLLVAIALESASFRVAIREANRERGQQGWWAFVRHAKSPELPVVLLEDLGALVGLVFALVGLGLSVVLDDPRWDALGSVAIGALLCVIAFVLAGEMKSLLIGESASARDRVEIRRAIEATPRVRRLIHLRTLHVGPDELLIGAKVEFETGLKAEDIARTIDEVEKQIRERVAAARMIYVEPDIHRAPDEPAPTTPPSAAGSAG